MMYRVEYPDGNGGVVLWYATQDRARAERSLANLRRRLGVPYLGRISKRP